MPFSYNWTEKRFYCKFSGIVDWQDFYAATGTLYGNSNLEILNEVILDFPVESQIGISIENIRELAFLDKAASRYNRKLNFAFVAQYPTARIMAENYINYSKEIGITWNYKVFKSSESALKWFNQLNKKENHHA